MKVWIMTVGDCENSGSPLLCATKEIAERELFKARDSLVKEWEEGEIANQESIQKYCLKENKPIWIDNMYIDMIKALSGNDYTKWDNYPHECPHIYETEILDR